MAVHLLLLFPLIIYGQAGPLLLQGSGGTITQVNISGEDYVIHSFTNTGTATFTPPPGVTSVEYLVVAGGGGGAGSTGNAGRGGGGAGGVLFETSYSVSTSNYTVVVGAGGAGGDAAGANGQAGSNSSFDGMIALGGGFGSNLNQQPGNGGSGGGSGVNNQGYTGAIGLQPAATSPGFGSNGGNSGSYAVGSGGGGGGGAGGTGGTGGDGATAVGGSGGIGLDYSAYFGTAVGASGWFAGGGGGSAGGTGGTGGTGGGGNGSTDATTPQDGISGTGGGGGGSQNGTGGAGGSGVVIIRYQSPTIEITSQPSANISSGQPFAQAAVVRILDGDGNPISGMTITANIETGTGSLNNTTASTNASGYATFTNLTITGSGFATYTLGFTTQGSTSKVVSNTITIIPSSPYTINTPGTSTFTVPEGVSCIRVEAWGAGGGGGRSTSNNTGRGGGGGGAYASSILSVNPGDNFSITVGAGGTGGNLTAAQNSGESSSFGSDVVAVGGGGVANNNNTAGAGGSAAASTGEITLSGGNGANGNGGNAGGGGGGAGSSQPGGDASGTTAGTGGTDDGGDGGAGRTDQGVGNPGNNFGGGGGGGRRQNASRNGGAGAPGQIIITWTGLTQTNTPAVNSPIVNGATSISGTSEANASIIVYSNGSQIATTTANGSGIWSVTVSARSTGQQITATAKLPGECTSEASSEVTVLPPTTITTGTVSPLSCCPGSSVSVPFTITGTFNSGNVFTAQLSNASGSFASPTNIGTLNSTTAGTISATIPGAQAMGTAYRIRVVSSDPAFTGNDNGSDIAVSYPAIVTSPGSQCKYGDDVTVTVSADASVSGTFDWYDSGYNFIKQENGSSSSHEVTIASTQTYYVVFTSGGCSTPYTPVNAYAIIPPSLDASAGGSFCVGTPINLFSEGTYDNIYWDGPNSFYSTEEDPVIPNATTGMSGTYTVYTNTLSGVNLIVNGDFEQGNTGFSSNYGYVAPTTNALWPEGLYSIVASPTTVHDNFIGCGDHTSGSGLQMVINGATTADVTIWSQTVNVVPNTYYQFTYWVQSVVGNNPSELQLFVNGVQAGPTYTAVTATCIWTQFLYNWSSGSNTTALLELRNQNTVGGGNDFALDDIVFQHTCTAEASVDVYVSTGFTPSVTISASPSNEICDGTEVTFTANPLHGGASPTYRWFLNGVEEIGETGDSYTRSNLNDTDDVTCEMTSSLTGCLAGSATVNSNTIAMVVHPLPTITTSGTPASVRSRDIVQTTTLAYTATTNSPTTYLIDWDATANAAGLSDQGSTAFTFSGTGGSITGITIPANVPEGTYSGTMTIVTDNGCEADQLLTIIIDPPSVFDSHPADLTICADEGGNLSVSVTASSPTYQWQVYIDPNWTDITPALLPTATILGETTATLSIDDLEDYPGTYQVRCEVTEGVYVENSNPATVTIHALPAITSGGVASTVCDNTLATTLSYASPQASPNGYSIDWDANANLAGLDDQALTAFDFDTGGGTLTGISITSGTPAGTYQGTMTIYNANGCESTLNVELTIRPLPDADISGTASVCINSTAPDITFTNLVGLPVTIDYNINGGGTQSINVGASTTASVSVGTSTAGDFTYTLESVEYQDAPVCIQALSGSATVTVLPENTAGAPSSTPSLCINTLMTDITHSTTGATGIGTPVDLPAGVSASWIANSITIGGTPTESGTFNYSIPLTGGCGSVNASGSITVYATPDIDHPGNQTSCGDYTLPVITGNDLTGNEAYYTATNGGGTQYNAGETITAAFTTLYIYDSNNGCSDEESFTITINRFNLEVSPNGAVDCPVLSTSTTPAFNAENSTYNPGASEVTFRVEPDANYSYNAGWTFSFTFTGTVIATSGSSTVTVRTLDGDDTTAPQQTTGNTVSGTIDAGANSYVDISFQVVNTPGSAQELEFIISNADDGAACGETEAISDNEATFTLEAMPEVGAFN